jgi:uncharacterized glyoxalase superfamily protein PhnB
MLTNRSAPPATVTPVLIYPDVPAAVAWLEAAFGFEERVRIGDAHRAQLRVGADGAVVVADVRAEQVAPSAGVVTHVVKVRVPDVDAAFERARDFGAGVLEEPRTWEYGERSKTWAAIAGSSRRRCATSSPRNGAASRSAPGRSRSARGDLLRGQLFPLRSEERVFDVALLLAFDVVGPRLVKRPHESQTCVLHHAS